MICIIKSNCTISITNSQSSITMVFTTCVFHWPTIHNFLPPKTDKTISKDCNYQKIAKNQFGMHKIQFRKTNTLRKGNREGQWSKHTGTRKYKIVWCQPNLNHVSMNPARISPQLIILAYRFKASLVYKTFNNFIHSSKFK